MQEYSKEAIKCFLEQQVKLLDQVVVHTVAEAKVFLAECMAVEVDTLAQVREFFEENDMDIAGMSDEEVESQSEVFPLPSGRYLIVTA